MTVLEYASSIWSPPDKTNIDQLKAVQKLAIPTIKNDLSRNRHRPTCITKHLHDLNWNSLLYRRKNRDLTLFFKILNGLTVLNRDSVGHPATYRSRKDHHLKLERPFISEPLNFNSFYQRTLRAWN